jgi:hypothetical protein
MIINGSRIASCRGFGAEARTRMPSPGVVSHTLAEIDRGALLQMLDLRRDSDCAVNSLNVVSLGRPSSMHEKFCRPRKNCDRKFF